MQPTVRIAMHIDPNDPYWVQTREAVQRRASQHGVAVVDFDIRDPVEFSDMGRAHFIEELLANDVKALICNAVPDALIYDLLYRQIPIVYLTETGVRHPLLSSTNGYYDIAREMALFLAEELGGEGTILLVGGYRSSDSEDGRSRVSGARDTILQYPKLSLQHLPSAWRYEHAYAQIADALPSLPGEIHAVFGLSDSIALAARDVARAQGRIGPHTLVVGINGDPLALAAIANGTMTATMDTRTEEFGAQALDIALDGARSQPMRTHFGYTPRLVTSKNLAAVAMEKLVSIAELPTRLVGVNRELEKSRIAYLETSLEISRRIGSILNRQAIAQELAELIRETYGYDRVQVMRWQRGEQTLIIEDKDQRRAIPEPTSLLRYALEQNEVVFVVDATASERFLPDPNFPDVRSRVVVPVRVNNQVVGLLDLHSNRTMRLPRQSLVALQALADQLGIAIRNAELYEEAVQARTAAENADQLKTRLLANVTHELRTPLNIILGYSMGAVQQPNKYGLAFPPEAVRDLQRIVSSSRQLARLINDLLDLSRAEIGELELAPETVDIRALLAEVFQSVIENAPNPAVAYRLALPRRLPYLHADPVRLRQILMNLLTNAQDFTRSGHILMGAEVTPPHVQIWIEDTGAGIPLGQQDRIFEPFVSLRSAEQRQGVGLGLSIARRLVRLHGGTITFESQPQHGSTFRLCFPLPTLNGRSAPAQNGDAVNLLYIAASETPDEIVSELCRRRGLTVTRLQPGEEVCARIRMVQPAFIAWDMSQAVPEHWRIVDELRRDPFASQTPFILYNAETSATGINVVADAPHLAQTTAVADSGALGVLTKPFAGASLIETIEAMRPAQPDGMVLVVDDDGDTCTYLAQLIRDALPARTVRVAQGGAEALAILAEETPCLVLLDLMMPEIDGFAVLERLRTDARTRSVPVIVLSGQLLARADFERIDHAFVSFQNKEILAENEMITLLRDVLDGYNRLPQPTSKVVKHTIYYIHNNYEANFSLQEVAAAVGVSKNYLTHIFQQELGISPWEFLNRFRIRQAKALLLNSAITITDVAARVGFHDPGYFSRVFRKLVGSTPHEFRMRSK